MKNSEFSIAILKTYYLSWGDKEPQGCRDHLVSSDDPLQSCGSPFTFQIHRMIDLLDNMAQDFSGL